MLVPFGITSFIYPYIGAWCFLVKQNYGQRWVGNGVITWKES